jgi:hypothetical protein
MFWKIMKRNRISCYFDLSESFVRMSDTDSDTEVGEAIRNPYRPAFLLCHERLEILLWHSQGSATLFLAKIFIFSWLSVGVITIFQFY